MPFAASAIAVAFTVIAAVVPPIHMPGVSDKDTPGFPAAPGYLLPWAGGEIHSVTQGEETTFTHNGLAAYAFDFDLNYDSVVAARSGRVSLIREDSNIGGCNAIFAGATNYVQIDHGDGTSGLYLHLAYDSVLVEAGDIVQMGQPIAVSGETGVTCGGGDDGAPGPHLHFQVQRTEDARYFTQSLPVAFDDVRGNEGIPQEGQSYVSGNYGKGQPQKVKLTPRRVERVFNPVAQPADPTLIEADPAPVPLPPPDGEAPGEWPADPAASGPGVADTPIPEESEEPEEEDTETPEPEDTPVPTDTPTPLPPPPTASSTATPTPTETPSPSPTDTPAAPLGGTPDALTPEPSATSSPGAPP